MRKHKRINCTPKKFPKQTKKMMGDVDPFNAARNAIVGDCVTYSIHLPLEGDNGANKAKLQNLKEKYEQTISCFADEYLWNQESFYLTVTDAAKPYLSGYVHVGDNIDVSLTMPES